jgi:hypothetical protein
MMETLEAIQPIYHCEQNQPILLYTGELELVEDDQVIVGSGKIEFTWLPKIITQFSICYNTDSRLFVGGLSPKSNSSLKFLMPEISTEKLADKALVLKKSSSNGSIRVVGKLFNLELGNGSNLSYVIFHLTNVLNYYGVYVEDSNVKSSGMARRLVLVSIDWRVTIDTINRNTIDSLEEGSGYAITHVAKLERIDGSIFSSCAAEEILCGLNYFLSFVIGRWVSPVLPVGFNSNGQRVWEKWLHYRTIAYNKSTVSWFPQLDPSFISVAFAGFMKWWSNEDWQESFKLLIYWYVESNNSGIEEGILMTQSACELLAWLVLVQERKVISDDGLDKLKSEDSLRLLFSWLQIPITMPPVPEKSPLFLEALQKMLKAESNLLDCAGCITAIRNRITHPKRKGKSTTILKYSSEERTEAYILSKWYLELCLLRLFGYDGVYANRLYKSRWEGDYDQVPWAS